MTKRVAGLTIVVATLSLSAQEPRFEVASVRQNVSPVEPGLFGGASYAVLPNGDVRFTKTDLYTMVLTAYGIEFAASLSSVDVPPQLRELMSKNFDIIAKEGSGTAREKLRTLLAERFGLRTHKEVRQLPLYELTVKEPGRIGLTPSPYNCFAFMRAFVARDEATAPREVCSSQGARPDNGGTRIRAAGTVDDLVLSVVMARRVTPVVNKTGLEGNFAWDVVIPRIEDRQDTPIIIGEVLKNQLGLELKRTTGPWEVLVLDDIQMPTPN